MSDYDITRINDAIWHKKWSIFNNKHNIKSSLNYISKIKIQIRKIKDDEDEITFLKSQIKIYAAKIKRLQKEMSINIKELKIYEAEYKKKRKDPNYNIKFDLLIKKHNKNNTYI